MPNPKPNLYHLPSPLCDTSTVADSDSDFIAYCELHCKSERALFLGAHVNRILDLAGNPEGFVASVQDKIWISVHEEMTELCRLARALMPSSLGVSNVFPFPPHTKV